MPQDLHPDGEGPARCGRRTRAWTGRTATACCSSRAGPASADPVMQLLNKVTCRGAANTGSGRTRIRIAPDVIRETRGMRLGRKVRRAVARRLRHPRRLHRRSGVDVGRTLRAPSRRGPVPHAPHGPGRNGDGQFDNYFHMKTMTIVGNVGGKRANYVTLNGSANWSSVAARSDENMGIYLAQGPDPQDREAHQLLVRTRPAFTPDPDGGRRVRPPGDGATGGCRRRAAVRHRPDQRRRPLRQRRHGLSTWRAAFASAGSTTAASR